MNHLHSLRATSTFSFSHSESRQGFALIITISLMAFLVLLLVTVSTFTRIETQVSSYSQKQSIAREHAKMGLEIAIGELQKYAGRDDRVTARADILTPPNLDLTGQGTHWYELNPYWTGVWNTNFPDDDPVWLVSGNEHTTVSDDFGGPTQFRFPNGHFEPDVDNLDDLEPWVALVDSGSAYVDGEIDGRVRVQRQPILVERYPGLGGQGQPTPGPYAAPYSDVPGHVIGHYAFWIGDEGIKANLARAGERYPYEEFISRQDPGDYSDFLGIVDHWGNYPVFGDIRRDAGFLYMEDDLVRSMSPGRFGFEFLNDPAQFNNYDFFQGFNPRTENPYSTSTRHFNARVSAWYRLLAPAHAGEDFIINSENDLPYGFTEEELKRLYYATTAHSRSVLATTEPSPNQDRALKTDLRRSTIPGDWGGNSNLNWANTWAESDYRHGGTASNGLLEYPLGTVQHSDLYRPSARPVVTHVHIEGVAGPGGYGTGHGINLQSLEVKLGLWNPYDVDLDFSNLSERVEIRLFHPESDENDPEPLQIAFGAGLHWLEREEPEDAGVSHFGSWLMEYYEAEGEEPLDLDFYSSPTPFAFEVTGLVGTTLLSGQTALFSTNGNSNLTRGRDGSPWLLPNGNIVDNFVYDAREINELTFDLQEVRPMLYFPNGREIRLEVVVVDNSDEVVDTLFGETVDIYALGDLREDVDPLDDVRGPFEGGPSTDWTAVWENGLGNNGWLGYPAFDNFHEGGMLRFALGADSRILPTDLTSSLQNLHSLGYDHRGDSSTGFYGHIIPEVVAWNGNERGYPIVMFENDGGANYPTTNFLNTLADPIDNLETGRQMVFYHILRNPGPELRNDTEFNALNYTGQEWDSWLPLTSVGQLRRGESGPDSGMFDNAFFSGSLVPQRPGAGNTADPREVFLFNPRLELFLSEDGLNSETWDRLAGRFDGNDRLDAPAAHMMLEGGFNVNSTSVTAWAALLNSFANHDLVFYDPFADEVFRYYNETGDGYPNPQSRLHSFFSRFPSAPGASFFGRDNANVGGPERSIWWNGFRELKPLDFRAGSLDDPADLSYSSSFTVASAEGPYRVAAMAMAEYIVERIREYYGQTGDPFAGGNPGSPFLSVSEFVESGILQEAIDRVQWGAPETPEGLNWYHDGNGWARIPRAAPSYLHQDDILASLGSVLTARSDTFVVRSYGDAHNPVSGEVEARAYLEAVVQRVPTPVVPDTAGNNDINPDPNSIHGRKFEVISFRWLSPDEI